MIPVLLAVLTGAVMFLIAGPGPRPGRPTRLARVYARLGSMQQNRSQSEKKRPFLGRLPLRRFAGLIRPLMTPHYRQRIERLLRISRSDEFYAYDDILGMKVFFPLLWLGYVGLLMLGKPDPVLGLFLGSVSLLAFVYPDTWLVGKARVRQEKILKELPAILSALAVALEAGLHLMAAVDEASRDRPGVLAGELRRAVEFYERGMAAAEALEAVTNQVEVSELTVVLTGLTQAFSKGSGHVVQTVRSQADEAWQKRKRRAEQLAQTASIKLFLPLALLALPGFLIFLLGPAVLEVVSYISR